MEKPLIEHNPAYDARSQRCRRESMVAPGSRNRYDPAPLIEILRLRKVAGCRIIKPAYRIRFNPRVLCAFFVTSVVKKRHSIVIGPSGVIHGSGHRAQGNHLR